MYLALPIQRYPIAFIDRTSRDPASRPYRHYFSRIVPIPR